MSQPEMFAMPDDRRVARDHSLLVTGSVHRAFPSAGERTRAVLASASSSDLVAST